MNNSQKWLFTLIVLIPAIILTVFFLLSGISVKELPRWIIIIPIIILTMPFSFLLAQRSAQKIDSTNLQEQKKRFLTVWGIYFIFIGTMLTILYCFGYYSAFWANLFGSIGFLLFLFCWKFRLFFPKKKEIQEAKH